MYSAIHRWAICGAVLGATIPLFSRAAGAREPIPDRLVVLTFDDSAKSHFTHARPLLKELGFGATFFITEGFDFRENKHDYMTWEEIKQLHQDGFEIGNHTRDHLALSDKTVAEYAIQLEAIDRQCEKHAIPKPVSFSYPGNSWTVSGLTVLQRHGIRFARRGGTPEYEYKEGKGVAYEPGLDHPLLIPTTGDSRPDWSLEEFRRAVEMAHSGRIAVLQFHGVPDTAHSWVNTPWEQFQDYMQFLARNDYRVIAMRDLEEYIDPTIVPSNPVFPIEDRQQQIRAGKSLDNSRTPATSSEAQYGLANMSQHGFTISEMESATGWNQAQIIDILGAEIRTLPPAVQNNVDSIRVLPYPGGRHPRRGFLDGAIRPQRETKFSLFAPWTNGGYVVLDVPEAIWNQHAGQRELLYLAHTHVPTVWTRQNLELEPLEWHRQSDDQLSLERKFPNAVTLGTQVRFNSREVRMRLTLTNGSDATLTGLVVQNCLMLQAAPEFGQVGDNRVRMAQPLIACSNSAGDRWIITGWRRCVRTWANPPCPCIHADPQFDDCPPGEARTIDGWASFYEGTAIADELQRIDALDWSP